MDYLSDVAGSTPPRHVAESRGTVLSMLPVSNQSPGAVRRRGRLRSRSSSRSLSVSQSPPQVATLEADVDKRALGFSSAPKPSDSPRRIRSRSPPRSPRTSHSASPIRDSYRDHVVIERCNASTKQSDGSYGRSGDRHTRRERIDGSRVRTWSARDYDRSRSCSLSPRYDQCSDRGRKRSTRDYDLHDIDHLRDSKSARYSVYRRPRSPSPGGGRSSSPKQRRRNVSPTPDRHSRHVDARRTAYRKFSPPANRGGKIDFRSDYTEEVDPERDARTVFIWQLAQKVNESDVRELFSRAGRIRDVRLIMDRRSRRHKGQGYVEFFHARSVPVSVALNGELVCGYPVAVKAIESDAANTPLSLGKSASAVPVEIPQPPPPPMPIDSSLAPLPRQVLGNARPSESSPGAALPKILSDSHSSPLATVAPGIVSARLVSVKELIALLNPHGLPVLATAQPISVASNTTVSTIETKGAAIGSISLPESQQVPLPIPGRHSASLPVVTPPTTSGQFKRLYVGSVPFTVSEDDLMTIFSPFGEIVSLQLQREIGTGRSRGYGFVEFALHESAKKALDLNGLVLAGRSLKVNLASATSMSSASLPTLPQASPVPLPGPAGKSALAGDLAGELDDGRDGGLAMSASQRTLLMKRLSRGEDMGTASYVGLGLSTIDGQHHNTAFTAGNFSVPCQTTSEPSRCLLLSNMFDPVSELKANPNFELEVAEDVRDEVSTKYGVVKHLVVDKASRGLVYIMLDSEATALAAKDGLNGRWFGGNRVSAEYVNEKEYKIRHPESPV
jgi:hypothetical protein